MRPEPIHILILVIVILLIFGAPKLPMIAKNIGKSLKVFKSEVDDLRGDKGEKDSEGGERREVTGTGSAPSVDDVTGRSSAESQSSDDQALPEDDQRRDS
ncbi:twin-arginine translocase TatA/TatE family subunit [Brevibacterium jeotgali]|uniref:Sec-independent protein translocase protein TatA n=1 Tax=Brevibacterium jeotgali TaxID=1262550 RepID=A0A2H1L1Y7_9MICO|nr:twin-arginine translocase TatA/TatE family subunit [Brevibacterium jeotgali]TWC02827.1 sec-independent protein translocase protein TatA [Brevibacterium jeotgali]SMY10849.1 sec-independent protein translocase protein TatA [Brevibacterium jeotgali]